MPIQHPTLVIDIDGVLADFHGALIEAVGPPQSQDGWGFEDWYTEQAQVDKANAFTANPESYRNLRPIPVSKKTVQAMDRAGWCLIVVTSRPKDAEDVTREWLRRNFRGCFDQIHVVGSSAEKIELIRTLNPHMVVDDNQKTIEALRQAGIPAIVFAQPWNWKCDPPITSGWTHFRKVMML